MVIDGATVITGSFNFTKNAEANNAENLLVIRSPELAAKYFANWKVHADHSEPYSGRTEGYSQTHREAKPADSVSPAPVPTSDGYVASKNSAVFHKSDCKSAAKISEKNLVRYATRDEAIQAGKQPCHKSDGGSRNTAVPALTQRASGANEQGRAEGLPCGKPSRSRFFGGSAL